MTKEERLKAILDELDELARVDRSFCQPRNLASNEPIQAVPYEVLVEWGERVERRQHLHEELRNLALEKWGSSSGK